MQSWVDAIYSKSRKRIYPRADTYRFEDDLNNLFAMGVHSQMSLNINKLISIEFQNKFIICRFQIWYLSYEIFMSVKCNFKYVDLIPKFRKVLNITRTFF